MKLNAYLSVFCILLCTSAAIAQHKTFKPENPVTPLWIKKHIRESTPRLILTQKKENLLKQKIHSDELVNIYYYWLKKCADSIVHLPELKRHKIGRRLLGVSRDAVKRMSILSLVARIESDNKKYIEKLNREVLAVCAFDDWNPSHFLDVGEMSLAVSIAIDWSGNKLPPKTIKQAKQALKKHLTISLKDTDYNWWINSEHNWNQVCHGGLSAAAVAIADDYPELASKIIARAIEKQPLVLKSYFPDGCYIEGPSYWAYGTGYSVIMYSIFETAFQTDFKLSQAPGFLQSATYRLMVNAPSGMSYNYFDSGDKGYYIKIQDILMWFAQKTGNAQYFNRDKYMHLVKQQYENEKIDISRVAAFALLWIVAFNEKKSPPLPEFWLGKGENPVVILHPFQKNERGFYFAAKGGQATLNHGNMDAGSFIFELDSVRWSIDPGNHDYTLLEEIIGLELWNKAQTSPRWQLLTKNNFGHSSITINNQLFKATGKTKLTNIDTTSTEYKITFDLSDLYFNNADKVTRTFIMPKNKDKLCIADSLILNDSTQTISWFMMTRAEICIAKNKAILQQAGKKINIKIAEPVEAKFSVTALNPPPLYYHKRIENLKRLEINIPAYVFKNNKATIIVEIY